MSSKQERISMLGRYYLIGMVLYQVSYGKSNLCSSNDFFPGSWVDDGERWKPEAACDIANMTGIGALQQLRGTTLLFFGDSILRQVYHSFVHGVIREMPVGEFLRPSSDTNQSRIQRPRPDTHTCLIINLKTSCGPSVWSRKLHSNGLRT